MTAVIEARCPKTSKRTLTRKDAMRQATWWRRNRHARMSHYRCKTCNGWHIGNNYRRPKNAKRRRR